MTDEQFEKFYKLLEAMDWKLWEIHNMVKEVLSPEEEGSKDDDN
jgi:succinate dehydrogenase flavin-adding protein (antitoxin of CptAB toxin-antitoxin module)